MGLGTIRLSRPQVMAILLASMSGFALSAIAGQYACQRRVGLGRASSTPPTGCGSTRHG